MLFILNVELTTDHRAMGQLFMMGWEGEEVTPQIRSLIADYGLGSVILTAKNLKCRLILYFFLNPGLPLLSHL